MFKFSKKEMYPVFITGHVAKGYVNLTITFPKYVVHLILLIIMIYTDTISRKQLFFRLSNLRYSIYK